MFLLLLEKVTYMYYYQRLRPSENPTWNRWHYPSKLALGVGGGLYGKWRMLISLNFIL